MEQPPSEDGALTSHKLVQHSQPEPSIRSFHFSTRSPAAASEPTMILTLLWPRQTDQRSVSSTVRRRGGEKKSPNLCLGSAIKRCNCDYRNPESRKPGRPKIKLQHERNLVKTYVTHLAWPWEAKFRGHFEPVIVDCLIWCSISAIQRSQGESYHDSSLQAHELLTVSDACLQCSIIRGLILKNSGGIIPYLQIASRNTAYKY